MATSIDIKDKRHIYNILHYEYLANTTRPSRYI